MDVLCNFVVDSVTTSLFSIVVLGFLSRVMIKNQLNKSVARYKQELDEKTAGLKNSLSIYENEYNVKTSRIDSQLSGAIKEIYFYLSKLFYYTDVFVNKEPPEVPFYEEIHDISTKESCSYEFYDGNAQKIRKISGELEGVLLSNAIYIDRCTFNDIYEIQGKIYRLSSDFLQIIERQKEEQDVILGNFDPKLAVSEGREQYFILKQQLVESCNELLLKRDFLTGQFRNKLGVENMKKVI
ncbi:hypothetical protein VT99_10175 [Candidatus Electrothrix marina]|uniref:Uncharacterized protein n=1 Tax=Candidatus Electrothrix marina TaxID=1859130 RepID=A0A444J7U2_9BACT|nr:hypothetical protein VT99_10175 [Candidatus Electrothrix marina]